MGTALSTITLVKGNRSKRGPNEPQCAFHVVNPEDLRREIELLLGVAAYSLLPWLGSATVFCLIRRNCWRDGVIYN